ncbi:hypothetical protein N7527_010245 [Penicillium freii]|nr:hypothetical protein N7527_010245 [Penicillium freii]
MSKLGVAFHPAPICGKPLRATREYLETAKRLVACFQYFATEGLADKIYHDPGCVTRHFDAIHLKEEPLKCNWCELEWNRICRIQREYGPEKFHTNPAREENEHGEEPSLRQPS